MLKNDKITLSHLTVRQSISLLAVKLVTLDIIVFTLIGLLLFLISNPVISFQYILAPYGIGLLSLIGISEIILTIYIVLEWVNEYFEISPHHIVHKRGVFFIKEDHYMLEHVGNVEVYQGIIGKYLNYGNIILYETSLTNIIVSMMYIHNPWKYERVINHLLGNVDEGISKIREHVLLPERHFMPAV
jgi:hypothetical protein